MKRNRYSNNGIRKVLEPVLEHPEPNMKGKAKDELYGLTESERCTSNPISDDYCPQCCQERCDTCKLGYNKFIVDMGDFSKDFGDGMRLCTMCEHLSLPWERNCGHFPMPRMWARRMRALSGGRTLEG